MFLASSPGDLLVEIRTPLSYNFAVFLVPCNIVRLRESAVWLRSYVVVGRAGYTLWDEVLHDFGHAVSLDQN